MAKEKNLVSGEVLESLPNLNFRVKIGEKTVLCYLCGKMMMNKIKVMPGDQVSVALSTDGDRGRIMRRV